MPMRYLRQYDAPNYSALQASQVVEAFSLFCVNNRWMGVVTSSKTSMTPMCLACSASLC